MRKDRVIQKTMSVRPFADAFLYSLSLSELDRLWFDSSLVFLGYGRTRIVFKSVGGKFVVKLAYNEEGLHDNTRAVKGGAYVANSSYWSSDLDYVSGLCIKMEWVEPIEDAIGLPDWVDYVDCQQVGYTLDNRLVAYDL